MPVPGRVLKRAGFALSALFTAFCAMFAAGSAADDPGGWKAVWLIAAWAVPLGGTGPARMAPARTGSGRVGPRHPRHRGTERVGGITRFAVAFSRGPGRTDPCHRLDRRPGPLAIPGAEGLVVSGAILVTLGVVPIVLSVWSPPSAPLIVLGAPPISFSGILYLASAALDRREGPGRTARQSRERHVRAA